MPMTLTSVHDSTVTKSLALAFLDFYKLIGTILEILTAGLMILSCIDYRDLFHWELTPYSKLHLSIFLLTKRTHTTLIGLH